MVAEVSLETTNTLNRIAPAADPVLSTYVCGATKAIKTGCSVIHEHQFRRLPDVLMGMKHYVATNCQY